MYSWEKKKKIEVLQNQKHQCAGKFVDDPPNKDRKKGKEIDWGEKQNGKADEELKEPPATRCTKE